MSAIAPTAAAEEAPPTEHQPEPAHAAAADASLLDLSTLVERQTISIDGTAYELRNVNEFGLVESHALFVQARDSAGLGEFDSLNQEQVDRASRALRKTIQLIVVDLPDEVLDKVSDYQRSMVLNTWRESQQGPARPGSVEESTSAAEPGPTPPPTTPES